MFEYIQTILFNFNTFLCNIGQVWIIHTQARNYKHWRYSYKTTHAKKVELEYLADL
jgi:membrane protein YdbS with pleckstrin-like domain